MPSSDLAQAFLDDFFIEADEHLQAITRHLLALEQGDASAAGSHERIVQELFRSFHTLKGLCGMVGLSAGAKLSHALETALKAVQRGELDLSEPALDALVLGTEKLEAVIVSMREGGSGAPSIEREMAQLRELTAPPPAARRVREPTSPPAAFVASQGDADKALAAMKDSLSASDWEQIRRVKTRGGRLYLVLFAPSAELSAQGVNVDHVRAWLKQQGELLKAIPIVRGGSVQFAFLWAVDAPPASQEASYLDWRPLPEDFVQPVTSSPSRQLETPVNGDGASSSHKSGERDAAGMASRKRLPSSGSMRVDIGRLDEIMRLVGDLVVSRSRLRETVHRLNGGHPDLRRELVELDKDVERQLRWLREAIMRARMAPLADVFERMPLVVRDMARSSGKEVRLEIEGAKAEIDKALVEQLLDPLLHLVRNAITHGIEAPAEREAAGKPREGRILLAARPEGNRMAIVVSDDGRGIDLDRIAKRAAELGWLPPHTRLNESEALDLLCRPGFSTHQAADLGAGRGVGMDVVWDTVRRVGGALNMSSALGRGTTFIMHLPLTLAIIDALLVRIGSERYAVPQTAIQRVIQVEPDRIVRSAVGELLPYETRALPLLRLNDMLQAPPAKRPRSRQFALISGGNDPEVALLVDEVLGMQEIVVRTIDDPLLKHSCAAGAAELGDGSVILILNIPHLLREGGRKRERSIAS
ncbi:MAG: chemotaxis protein CheA [Chloroflexi bacterium]|nr:chemotaxis protein CheA [Chloroflexota bacterium]